MIAIKYFLGLKKETDNKFKWFVWFAHYAIYSIVRRNCTLCN